MVLRTLVLVAFVFSAGSSALFYVRLRTKHRDQWVSLGSPGFFRFPLGRRMRAYREFLFSRDVDELQDPILSALSRVMAFSGTLTLLLFILAIVLRWRY